MDEIVLSWTIEDICTQDLYKDEVMKIPDEFHSLDEYLESYTHPLIEETRAKLFSGLETILEAPSAKIHQIALEDTKHGLVCRMDILADGFSSGTDMYEPKNGDVFVLSSLKPKCIDDLLRYGVTYCLSIVKKVVESKLDEVDVNWFTMSVSTMVTSVDQIERCTYALYLTSMVTNSRIWKALKYHYRVDQNFTLLKKVLNRNQMEENKCGSTHKLNHTENTRVLEQLRTIDLNQAQLEAIKSTISVVQCNKLSSIELVRGPPGTGKTKTVGLILWSLEQLKIRTLTCAPTNVAVLGVCLQLLHLVKNLERKNGDSDGPPLSLADVVLFGNRGGMDIVGDLEDVFLDSRIEQLENCFSSDTTQRCGVASMIHLLEVCSSMYDMYVENCKEDHKVRLNFGDYLREQFKEHEMNLNNCFRTLFVHLPRRFLSSENCLNIIPLQDLLRELSCMMSSSILTDEQLKQVFETPLYVLSTQKDLIQAREECLKKLRNLQETLNLTLSFLTNSGSIRDFCLQNATLIFCTASSSFLLHGAQTTYFDVVVIDEAAQLKECESVIPLMLNHVKHALLVGDECQLPAMVQSKVSERDGFGRSLFERLVLLQHERTTLNIQYRMHPSISLFPNNRFYDGKILDGPNVLDVGYNRDYLQCIFGSYAFVDIADGREERDDVSKSFINRVEVAVVLHLIKTLYESWKRMNGTLSVGVISPYAAQVKTMRDKIGRKYDNDVGFEVRMKSIDGFQGQEDDVIILSMVRCNNKGNVGFLYNNQRSNVAITRARHCLWIVGCATTLLKSRTIWSEIVVDANQRGRLFDAKDVEDMAKLILKVKNELDQLVDLMDPNSVLFSSTRWKVVFSNEFIRSFARLKSKHDRMGLIKMLLRLADGWRSKRRNLSMGDFSCPLTRLYPVAEYYLVWSIDLQNDQDKQVYTQIIKLWNLVPLVEVEGLLKRMNYIFSMYTDAYMERCKTVCNEGTIEVPMMWIDKIAQYRKNDTNSSFLEDPKVTNSNFLEDSKVSESLVLMRFYASSSGIVRHLLMARDGSEIDIPFELNEQEMEIIQFPNSSFILGRSGTGKTTILTTKLVRREQQFFIASHGMGSSDGKASGVVERGHENEQMKENMKEVGFIKQVFLTVSPKLCSVIRDEVNRLVRFANFDELSGPIDSVTMHDVTDKLDEFTNIPDNFNDLTQEQYPLIITFWKFLMMLDGTIRYSFFNKFYSDWGDSMEQGISKSHTLNTLIQSKEVDFDKFSVSYWPHFNEKLTKNMDASTVFAQIISHIKGEIGCMKGAIGRKQYVAISERRCSSLSSAVRERVYDIFLEYEKKKRAAREFDLSDLVINLHRRLRADGYSSYKFDFVYIDEVQDFTVSQIALLKYVSYNFKEGFVFAGDTAQTIARGIDFRFEDIKSLFYKEFLSELKGKEKETRLSDMFQLCQNFRTHIGVLRLAQSVIDLLYHFFPFSVDKLNPETSLIYGDAPVLLESDGDENAITKIFGGRECFGSLTEFGAEQVILVRDDSAKKEILDIVGKQALVLTIIDCKGLEFQDVLLYNFFGSSPLENKWRVLYGYLENEDIIHPSTATSYPRFDITTHYLLCSELKQLYVAITRTKQRLWICENLTEFCKPMFNYWKRLCLVQGAQLDTDFVKAMQTASTSDDWRVRGIKLFNERQFEMARMCFEKAGDVYNENWARAACLVDKAEHQIFTNLEKAHTALHKAADIYEAIQMYDNAAACYIKMGNYMKAGTIYFEKCGTSRLEDAGDCFSKIKCLQQAANAYFQANCFSKCTSVCLKAELFDAGLKYLEKWRLQEEKSTTKRKFRGLEATRDDYLKNCADRLYLCGDYMKMMHFVKAFKSMEEARTFLIAKSLLVELLDLELGAGNFIEAARIARLKEDLLLEAHVWEKAGSFEKATRLVILAMIMESLWLYGSTGWCSKSISKSEVYFTKAKDLAKKVSRCFHNSVCSEVYLWGNRPKTFSELLNLLVEAEKCKNTRLTFMSLRSLLDLHLNHENTGYLIEEEPQLDLKKWFHEMMVQERVSLNTLIHIWVQWRDVVAEVSSPLCEFCLDYLGVRKDDSDGTYCVLNPNASWIGDKVRALLKKSASGGYFMMASHLYATCATSYWKNEVFSVGKAVVEKLDSLLRSCSKQTFCPETRGRVSLLVYEIIKYVKKIRSSEDNSSFLSCIVVVEALFWDTCFPWDSKICATQGVISIIDCPAAVELLDELLDRLLGLAYENGKFTYGQLGKLSRILLLSGKLPNNQLQKIMQFSENMPQWKKLFDSLKGFFIDGSERVSMVVNFQKALQATYEVNWRQEPAYMSPHCYIYLLELLNFFASSCLPSASHMITTRSVLAEIVKLRGCKNFLDSPLDQMASKAMTPTCLLSLFEFIVSSIKELICNRSKILEWINKCSSSLPGNFYHQMVLRLAIILHMAYLNKSLDFYSAGKFLSNHGEISRMLPVQFSSKLHQARNSWDRDMNLVAFVDAFASVGDPLVVISQKEDNMVFPQSNFFFFKCNQMRDRDHVMSVLFSRSTGPDVIPSVVNSTDLPSITVAEEVTGGTKDGKRKMDESIVKMLEAFQQCEKRDIAGTVDILGVLLSSLHQNKPPKSFYDQLFEDICSVFDKFGNITLLAKGNACLEDLYSYWQDGEAKLNLIIDTLISEKMSKEALEKNTKDSTLEEREIVIQTGVVKKEVKEEKRSEDSQKEFFWNEIQAFQQGTYQKKDMISMHNLLFAALSLLREKKSLINFDGHLIEEMKTVYSSFSNLLERGDGLTLEDLYSDWPHGEIKLKLMIDTLLTSFESKSDVKEASMSDDKEASKSDDKKASKSSQIDDISTKGRDAIQPRVDKPKEKSSFQSWVENTSKRWHIEGGKKKSKGKSYY